MFYGVGHTASNVPPVKVGSASSHVDMHGHKTGVHNHKFRYRDDPWVVAWFLFCGQQCSHSSSRELRVRENAAKIPGIYIPQGCHHAVPRTYRNCTRAVRKVSSHFEYLENWSRGFDVTWQPVRGDLTAHPWTVTLPWD